MQTVDALLSQLSSEGLEVMEKYFGLSGGELLIVHEIGRSTGLGEDRVIEVVGHKICGI